MQVNIITPEKTLFSADAEMVTIPGTEGDFGVLPGHAPFISTIRPGIITINLPGGQVRKLAIISGIAEAVPERCTVLAETAEECTDITPAEIQTRLDAAKSALSDAVTDKERETAEKQFALAQALALAA